MKSRFLLVMVLMTITVQAQTSTNFYWTNTASGVQVWNASNWTNAAGAGVTPANGGDASYILAFAPAYNVTLTPSNDFSTVPFVLNGITAQGGTLWSVLLKGGGLMLTNNGSSMPAVRVQGGHSVNAKLYLDLPLTLATNTLLAASNGALHVRAVIGGAGGLAISNLLGGVVSLYSNNTFSGGVDLQSGTLEIKTANALGSGSLTLQAGATLWNQPTVGGTVTNDIVVAGDATLNNNQSTGEKYTGRLSGASTLSVTNVGLDLGTNALANFNGVLDLNLNNLTYADGTERVSLRLSEAGLYNATNATLQLTRATLTNTAAASINLGALTGTTNGYVNLGTNTLTVGYLGQANTFDGVIQGASLVKVGTGTLILTGANIYTNTTTINNGFIAVGGSQALGTKAVILSGGGLAGAVGGGTISNVINLAGNALFDTSVGDLTIVGTITNSGKLTKIGTGSLTLSAANTYSGGTVVSNGTVVVDDDQALGLGFVSLMGGGLSVTNGSKTTTNVMNMASNAFWNVSDGATLTVSAAITNSGGLFKTGGGTLILSAVNTYTGVTSVSNGVLGLTQSSCLSTNIDMYLYSGATCDLNFAGTQKINTLYINGVVQNAGIYNSANLSAYLTGAGNLEAVEPSPRPGTMFMFF